MTPTTPPDQFHVAVFHFDGTLEGIESQRIAGLSEKWLAVCEAFLDANGPAFRDNLGGPLAHIDIQFTSTDDCALVTFYVLGRVVTSIAVASGISGAGRQALEMFVDSLRKIEVVRSTSADALPFGEILRIHERPLVAIVVWPGENLSDQDDQLVKEISYHLAAAYLRRLTPVTDAN